MKDNGVRPLILDDSSNSSNAKDLTQLKNLNRNHFMIRRLFLILVAAVLVLSTEPAFAWESDFHYGLTKWLAIKAGFSTNDAETIAQGALNLDHGINDARFLVFHYACLGSDDLQASEKVRNEHFPSFENLPSQPTKRIVVAGSDAAAREALKEVGYTGPGDRKFVLKRFGETLHPLQDSWSHDGIPGIPWTCSDELAWGHPGARGGWWRHNADFTYLYPKDAINAAKATYEMMQAYLGKRRWPSSGMDWNSIEADVGKFAERATKSEKEEWFANEGFTNFDFLTETYLDDGKMQFPYSARLARMSTKTLPKALKELSGRESPDDLQMFFKEFFAAWIMEKEYKNVMNRFVDTEAVGRSMAKETRDAIAMSPDMVAARFWIWRLRDHGLANKLGHGMPLSSKQELLNDLWKSAGQPNALTAFESIRAALLPLGKDVPPYLIVELPRRQTGEVFPEKKGIQYAALARFKNAPYDVVMVTASKNKGEWRVVSLTWTIDH